MKIIFLDIDGVLNVNVFQAKFINNLKTIIEATDAKIVISSSWRKKGLSQIQDMWLNRGMPGVVIDTTPSIYTKKELINFWNDQHIHPTPRKANYSIPRGCEIQYWLHSKGFRHINWSKEEQQKYIKDSGIESYVILDDDSDMLYEQRNNFVKTSLNYDHEDSIDGLGLTKQCTQLAIKILNGTK